MSETLRVGTSFATQPVSALPDPLSPPSGPSDGPPLRRLLCDRVTGEGEARMAQRRRDLEALVWTAFTASAGTQAQISVTLHIKGLQTAQPPIGAHSHPRRFFPRSSVSLSPPFLPPPLPLRLPAPPSPSQLSELRVCLAEVGAIVDGLLPHRPQLYLPTLALQAMLLASALHVPHPTHRLLKQHFHALIGTDHEQPSRRHNAITETVKQSVMISRRQTVRTDVDMCIRPSTAPLPSLCLRLCVLLLWHSDGVWAVCPRPCPRRPRPPQAAHRTGQPTIS